MSRTVRLPKRVYRQARLNTHYESYLTVLPNDTARFVPGEGDVMSDVVFIGEAPGEQEDAAGRPFIGNLLSKLLNSIGLNRRDVFITNLVKHRPPNNADPDPGTAQSARVLLRWELQILQPRVVVPLGRFATETFYPTPHMQALHGTSREKLIERHKAIVVPMYHPAAGLRSSAVRRTMYDDFKLLKQVLGRN
jgi:uracil-DNA glycosylase family 4